MIESRKIHINLFTGGVDTDSDLHRVSPEDFISARNIRNGYGVEVGCAQPVLGNLLLSYTLPAGDNICIGSVEDRINQSLIYFIYNSNGNHRILQYLPDEGTNGAIVEVSSDSFLNFNRLWYIHSAKVIDGKLLYWPNAVDTGSGIEGNPPLKLNIQKAVNDGKNLNYHIAFGDDSFDAGSSFDFGVEDLDGSTIVATSTIYTVPAGPPPKDTILSDLATAINSNAAGNMTATARRNSIFIEGDVAERVIVWSGTGHATEAIPENHYPALTEEMALVLKPFPTYPFSPIYNNDPTVGENKVYGYSFKFRCRYVFDDNEKSAWGVASYVPTNFLQPGSPASNTDADNDEFFNVIDLPFDSRDLVFDAAWRSLIAKVEVAVQFTDDGIWRAWDSFDVSEFGLESHSLRFLNNADFSAVPSDEAGAENIQSLKNFDFVPRMALSMQDHYDEDGNLVMVYSGMLEGWPLSEPSADVSVSSFSLDAPPSVNQASNLKCFKSGGVYQVAVVYKRHGYQAPALPLGRARMPFSQIGVAGGTLSVQINNDPPSWAEKYQLVITRNQNQTKYAQLPAFRVVYWIIDPTSDAATSASPITDATHVGFEFTLSDLDDDDLRNYLFEELASNDKRFIPSPGDRVQVLNFNIDGTGGDRPQFIDIEDYNFEIAGYSLTYPSSGGSSIDRFTVFIEYDSSQPNFAYLNTDEHWILCEIYTPGVETSDEFYYEIGECYDIVGGAHETNPISLEGFGDTFVTRRTYENSFLGGGTTAAVPNVQRPTLHRRNSSPLTDMGRPVVSDPDHDERYNFDRIRFTQLYVPGTGLNGLSSFRGTDFIRVSRSFGPIQKLAIVDQVMLAICSFKTQPIYLGRGRMMDLSGNTSVGRTSKLFNIANELKNDWGTHHPESVDVDEGMLYCWDVYKGIMWSYTTGGGQVDIGRYGQRNYFLSQGEARRPFISSARAIGRIDRRFDTYYLTFNGSELTKLDDETIGFQRRDAEENMKNKWVGNFDFIAEQYGKVGLVFVSFKEGQLYVHEQNPEYCNFYGVSYGAKIEPCFNPDPTSVKMPMSFIIEASTKWYFERIEIPATASYPDGMSSEVIPTKVELYEGQFKGDFLRDMTDNSKEFVDISPDPDDLSRRIAALLRGRYLRGEVMVMLLALQNRTVPSKLRALMISYYPSEPTK